MARRAPKTVAPIRLEEQAILQAIVDHPQDTARWLILADWLEENDDPRRAELLRLHRQLLATCCEPDEHPERAGQQARMVELLSEGVRPCVPRRTVTLTDGVDMVFHFIPPGSFLMGSPVSEEGRDENETHHRVTLTQSFWLGVTPVTQRQWQAVLDDNPSHFWGEGSLELPVDTVSWEDCQEYCRKLGEQVGKSFRLASEAEWEYACRAGTTTPFFWGQTLTTEQANYDGNYPYGQGVKGESQEQTTAVGSLPCNGWGLYDMHGNVWEWCQDRYGKYGKGTARDPKGPKRGAAHVLRGGSWYSSANWCRAAFRVRNAPASRHHLYGCRVIFCLD